MTEFFQVGRAPIPLKHGFVCLGIQISCPSRNMTKEAGFDASTACLQLRCIFSG